MISHILKYISAMDGLQDLIDELLLQEQSFASIRDEIPITQVV